MFGEIVDRICCSWFPKHVVVALVDSICCLIELHIHCFGTLLMDGLIYYPPVVKLYPCMVFSCFGWPIDLRVTLIGYPGLELRNNDPTSASAANDITFSMMLESVRIYPLDLLV